MEYVNCSNCGLDDTQLLFQKKDKFRITEDEFNVVECRQCGLLYVNPRPTQEEMGKFYPATYSWKETLEVDSSLTNRVRKLEKGYRYHLLKDEVSKVLKFSERSCGKVLDVGCSTGDRLDVFRRMGFEAYGVETSDSADFAKEYLKLKVIKGDLFSAQFPSEFFDLVTLYNVLEHTHNPVRICHEIYRILKEDGLLVIQVPNTQSFQCKLLKRRWAAFDVPRDLYYFKTETLSSLLKRAGFNLSKADPFMNWWHPPTLVRSVFPSLEPQKAWRKEGKGGSALLQRVAWILCTLIAGPVTYFESWLRRGAIVTYYFLKSASPKMGC
jgi:SAM-dependent methyltransferase